MAQDETSGDNRTDSAGGAALITCGKGRDVITIGLVDGIIQITAEEEVSGPAVVEAARQAVDLGLLRPGQAVLVDIVRFVGTIDWGAIHTVRGMRIWTTSEGETSRVAFLVRGSAFASLVTLAGALFPRTSLRLFTDRDEALAWLKAAP